MVFTQFSLIIIIIIEVKSTKTNGKKKIPWIKKMEEEKKGGILETAPAA